MSKISLHISVLGNTTRPPYLFMKHVLPKFASPRRPPSAHSTRARSGSDGRGCVLSAVEMAAELGAAGFASRGAASQDKAAQRWLAVFLASTMQRPVPSAVAVQRAGMIWP